MKQFSAGNRVYLRGFRTEDLTTWFKWFNDPDITDKMNKGFFPNTLGAQESYLEGLVKSKNDIQLAIVMTDKNTLVGSVGLHKIDWIHRHGDISVLIGDCSQSGKGIAAEAISLLVDHAFQKIGLNKLNSGMWAPNIASKKCFVKNGFVHEGTIREQFFYKGKYVDEIRMGLTYETYQKNK